MGHYGDCLGYNKDQTNTQRRHRERDMKTSCPFCGREEDQVKAGLNGGNQRYKCGFCRRRYTPSLRERGYSHTLRQEALSLLGEGVSAREIGRRLGIHYRTVA